jgi:nicotinamide-nucleotide amidase
MHRAIEVVTVGTELLLGETVDTNAARIGQALAGVGIAVTRRATVGDQPEAIAEAIGAALDRTRAAVVTGGLGPTRDDLTREAVAALLGVELRFDDAVWQELQARWARVGRTIAESNRAQAMVPEGGDVLPNRLGSAPGLWIDSSRGLVILLPGVPIEVDGLLADEVLPRLVARYGAAGITSRLLRTTGIPESRLGELLGPLEASFAPVTLAYLPDQVGVDLRLTAWQLDAEAAAAALDTAADAIRTAVGRWIYTETTRDLAEVVLEQARAAGETIAVAESCTGGLVAARLTDIPGSSDVFLGGVVAYGNPVKIHELGVSEGTLAEQGAVSEAVAREMALGVADRLGADRAVAVTGVAGPGGGSEEKPVGTVWFAWAKGGVVVARLIRFPGDRTQVRHRAAQAALRGLLDPDPEP